MNKEQENGLKYLLFSNGYLYNKTEFDSNKIILKASIEMANEIFNKEEDTNYVDELSYEMYFEWFKEFHKKLQDDYFYLINKINEITLTYFNSDECTYTGKDVQKILSDNNIFNLLKGFGNLNETKIN